MTEINCNGSVCYLISHNMYMSRMFCDVQKLDSSPYRRKGQWDRQDFINLCIHTFTAESEQSWDVSVNMMAYIMCCLDMIDLQAELAA